MFPTSARNSTGEFDPGGFDQEETDGQLTVIRLISERRMQNASHLISARRPHLVCTDWSTGASKITF